MTRYSSKPLFLVIAFAIFAGLIIGVAHADLAPEAVRKTKSATVMVDVGHREFGTAFCIDKGGLFVTNAHVVEGVAGGLPVSLIVNSGAAAQKILPADVLRIDAAADLALLRARTPIELPALELGVSKELLETDPLVVFGFPLGTLLAGDEHYPAITISSGRVTALRKNDGVLQRIQLDASINPGNSGGPVLDSDARVVGVVVSTVLGSGVSFAIPVEKLAPLLQGVQIVFTPPPIPFAQRHVPQRFEARLVTLGAHGAATEAKVDLELKAGSAPPRKSTLHRDGDLFTVSLPLLPESGPPSLGISAEFPNGAVGGSVSDLALSTGSKSLRLSEVRTLRRANGSTQLTLANGSTLDAEPKGLESVQIDCGAAKLTVDLSKATFLEISPPPQEPGEVAYHVTATGTDGKVIAELSGSIPIGAQSASIISPGTQPVAANPSGAQTGLEQDAPRRAIQLPASIGEAMLAGEGRLLVLNLPKLQKAAIVNLARGTIDKYIDLPAPDVHIAAGARKLLVLSGAQKTMEIWNLQSFQRDTSIALPLSGILETTAMGWASDGPLLLRTSETDKPLARSHFTLFDLKSLKAIGADISLGVGSLHREPAHIYASGSGDVFAVYEPGMGRGVATVVWSGGKATTYSKGDPGSTIYALPGPDGSTLFTAIAGLFTQRMEPIESPGGPRRGRNYTSMLPSGIPGLYMGFTHADGANPLEGPPIGTTGSIYLAGTTQPIAPLPQLPELVEQSAGFMASHGFGLEQRVFLLPALDLLVTIPTTNDVVYLRTFRPLEVFKQSGADYLLFWSNPLQSTTKAALYRYAADVRSKRGGLRYKLETGPAGMTISPGGEVRWQVPASAAASNAVVISVQDAQGRQVFQSYTLSVQ